MRSRHRPVRRERVDVALPPQHRLVAVACDEQQALGVGAADRRAEPAEHQEMFGIQGRLLLEWQQSAEGKDPEQP